MANLRVSLGFAGASDHELEEITGEVISELYTSAIYPAPPVLEPALQAALDAFRDALAMQESRGAEGTAIKDQARGALVTLMRQLALYVQMIIQGNPAYGLAELLASGFDAVSSNRTQQPLTTPNITEILNVGEGTLKLRATASKNARNYEVHMKLGTETAWQSAGLFSSTRGIVVGGLTPGAVYDFRMRAIGGSTGHSDWSNAVSRRSL
jgi:hypothetical protein